jgi:hypothetical protein
VARTTIRLVLLLGLSLAGCDNKVSGAPPDAQQTADVLTGDAAGDASTNPQCRAFTVTEIAGFAGTPVQPGNNAAMGTGCQWLARNDHGFVMVQVVRAQDHNPPSGAPGYRELPAVGRDGFIVDEGDSWSAGTIHGDKSINIMVSTGADEQHTLAFLREVMKRTPAS